MIYAPRGFAMGRFCFAQKYIKRIHISIHNNRKGVPHELEKAACLHLYQQLLLRPAHHRRGVGGAAGCAGLLAVEIGIAESVFHMVSLTFEVPSGMAADLLGRRKTLVAGGVCMVLSNLLMAFAPDLFFICLAMALSALANAMFSGTASALTYDSLKQCGRTDDYLRVSANCSQLSMLATAVGSSPARWNGFSAFPVSTC